MASDLININTSTLGTLEVPISQGLYKLCNFDLDGQKTSVVLHIFEDFLSTENINLVQNLIEQIDVMYHKAKKHITLFASSNETIQQYISFHIEELGDELLSLFNIDSMDQLTPELFINHLEPRTISVGPHANYDVDCVFDFSLPEDFTDELLVISFDPNLEIYNISHES
ncbi:DUF2004 domain-containing protein [Paenibacillus turicensis]|uniref:DUF2004 domain-containing protein n=1 Tax=Paenibacillus turicensis TaxID=160487 RepID=UPI003D29F8A8